MLVVIERVRLITWLRDGVGVRLLTCVIRPVLRTQCANDVLCRCVIKLAMVLLQVSLSCVGWWVCHIISIAACYLGFFILFMAV